MRAEVPNKLAFLYEPHRYKVIFGGRGKGASWGMADALLIQGTQRPLRWLCTRETQESIEESVHTTLSARIIALGLERFYEVQKAKIISRTFSAGTEGDPLAGRCGFSFAGLRHNTTGIKSYEGYDGAWVEEAQGVTKESWEILIPTMRKDGSEIWVSFNPGLDTDETYKRFVIHPPADAVVVQMNWRNNPFFPEVLRKEKDALAESDPEAYEHVYEGHPRSSVIGAIYANEIRKAEQKGQFTKVPYDQTHSVDTFWDLGYGDMCSIWFAQAIAFEYRIIDYYENTRQSIEHYVQAMQSRGYTYGTAVLPWDGGAKQLGTGRSIEEIMRAKGFKVRVLPQFSIADGINAVRTIFPQCFFDSERCEIGIQHLRRYQWGAPAKTGQEKRAPLHDEHSHAADALRTMGAFIKPPKAKKPEEPMKIVRPPTIPGAYAPFG